MKNLLLAASMVLAVYAVSYGQSEGEMETPSATSVQPGQGIKLKDQLQLSSNQETQLRQILMETRQARQSLKDNPSLKPDELKAGLSQIRLTREERIKAVLKPAQLNKWNGFKAKIQQAHKAQSSVIAKGKLAVKGKH